MGSARRRTPDQERRLFGAHVPTAGGLHRAPAHGDEIGASAIQIFTRNQMQWDAKPVSEDEARAFGEALAASRVQSVLAHASYLLNLAAPDDAARERSVGALVADAERCAALRISLLVFHPGAHMDAGEEIGLTRIARSLDRLLEATRKLSVRPCIEVTAGQGSSLGHRFEHVAEILARVKWPERLGVCLDTCHLFAAGYDIKSPKGYERTMADLQRLVGLERVAAVHVNDAKKPLGSHVDRHAALGQGEIGLPAFRRLLGDPHLAHLPMVAETPGPIERWRDEVTLMRKLGGDTSR